MITRIALLTLLLSVFAPALVAQGKTETEGEMIVYIGPYPEIDYQVFGLQVVSALQTWKKEEPNLKGFSIGITILPIIEDGRFTGKIGFNIDARKPFDLQMSGFRVWTRYLIGKPVMAKAGPEQVVERIKKFVADIPDKIPLEFLKAPLQPYQKKRPQEPLPTNNGHRIQIAHYGPPLLREPGGSFLFLGFNV